MAWFNYLQLREYFFVEVNRSKKCCLTKSYWFYWGDKWLLIEKKKQPLSSGISRSTALGHLCIAQTKLLVEQGKAIPLQACYKPIGFQEVEAPRLLDSQHIKMLKLSALCTGRLFPLYLFLVLISVRDSVDRRALVRPEGLFQWKLSMTFLWIEPATFWLVAQCLNQPCHNLS
jgi:hypothetical protein